MKLPLLFVLFALLSQSIPLYAQDLIRANRFGGFGDDNGAGVAVDSAGNLFLVGAFEGTIDLDPGSGVTNVVSAGLTDVYLAKFDSAGDLVWARRMGGPGDDAGSAVALDAAGNIYLSGVFSGAADFDPGPGAVTLNSAGELDIFIAKFDSGGNLIWARGMGGPGDEFGFDVAVDSGGNAFLTGAFEGTADFDPSPAAFNMTSAGGQEAVVLKLTSAGSFAWAKRVGGTSDDFAAGIALDAAGNVYAMGVFQGTVDFDPGPGVVNGVSNGDYDGFILKLNTSGEFVWHRQGGGPGDDGLVRADFDAAGNIYMIGVFQGTVDFDPGPGVANLSSAGDQDAFVLKVSPSGEHLWARSMGGPGLDGPFNLAVDGSGNVVIIGDFENTADFDPGPAVSNLTSAGDWDAFISKLDQDGDFVWARRVGGGSGDDEALGMALDGSGQIHVTGYFAGTADFDPGPATLNLSSAGDDDIFLLKLSNPAAAGNPPVITEDGIVLATLLPTVNSISPLSIISVFGQNFSTETILFPDLSGPGQLATVLGGTCLMMDGEALPIFAMTPTQINAQVSAAKSFGPASFTVVTNCGTAQAVSSAALTWQPEPQELTSGVEMATVEAATPGFFLFDPLAVDGFIAARFNEDAVAVAPAGMFEDQYGLSRPAAPGEIVLLYGTGWGDTSAALAAGELASEAAEVLTQAERSITFGGVVMDPADVLYVGVTPGAAGLFQAAIRIPASAQPGNNQVVLTVYGKSTPVGPVIPVAQP